MARRRAAQAAQTGMPVLLFRRAFAAVAKSRRRVPSVTAKTGLANKSFIFPLVISFLVPRYFEWLFLQQRRKERPQRGTLVKGRRI
jgi:hypothetical protein